MKRPQFQTLLTSLLLLVFAADATNALALYAPHRVALHEVGAHLETSCTLAHDEFLKHPPIHHLIKFTDIDSPLLQAERESDGFSATINYAIANDCKIAVASPPLISLHKLCILLL
ncbi:MAG: hypothetical protein SNJ55_07150 [Chloroherpetonaceae bacterium]